MNIAIILIHNKSDLVNVTQINSLKALIVKNSQIDPIYDDSGKQIGSQTSYYYTIKNLIISHKVKFFQIIPQGINKPANLDDIDSHKVFYGNDQPSIDNRFFNWGLKRATDYGADTVIQISDHTLFSVVDLDSQLQKLALQNEFVETNWGNISTNKLLKTVGQLKEDMNLTSAYIDYKTRMDQEGIKYSEKGII